MAYMPDDDIERLLNEIGAMEGGSTAKPSSTVPATSGSTSPANTSSRGGVLRQSAMVGLGMGAATGLIGLLMPFFGTIQMGVGGFLGAFGSWFLANTIKR